MIEGAVLLCDGPNLTRDKLPAEFLECLGATTPMPVGTGDTVSSMAEGEEVLIRRAVIASDGNLTSAARRLRIAKSTLYAKMQRYGISR